MIHATATGLVALGWYEVYRDQARQFVFYAGAEIGLHTVWNGLAGLSAVAGLQLFGESAGAQALNTGGGRIGGRAAGDDAAGGDRRP